MSTPSNKRRTFKDLMLSSKKFKSNSSPLSSPLSLPLSSPLSTKKPRKLLFDDVDFPDIQSHVEILSSFPLASLEYISPRNIQLIILSKYGLGFFNSLSLALETVPSNFPDRIKYITNIVNTLCNSAVEERDVAQIQSLLEESLKSSSYNTARCFNNQYLWECSKKYQEPYNAFLVPPVSNCLQSNCDGEIYFHYKSRVTLHTLEGPVPAQKATFRCRECNSIYNIDGFSTPGEGKRFYSFPTMWKSASNRVYFSNDLHELMCESGNHAFVSHQAFSEIYNSVFCYSSESTNSTAMVQLFENDEKSISEDEGHFDHESERDKEETKTISYREMTRKQATNAYFNGELNNELLHREITGTVSMSKERHREDIMREIDNMRRNELYAHTSEDCSDKCKTKGCKDLRVIDSCWKVCMPHCMFSVENEVDGYPLINFPNVCTNEPLANSVFCKDHHKLLQKNGVPTNKEDFLRHIGCKAYPTTQDDIKVIDEKIVEFANSLHQRKETGTSATNFQGVNTILENSKTDLWTDGKSKSTCNKDTGEKARLRQRSRGHFISVTGGGHIQFFNPIFKSESPCQILMLVIRTIYLELKDKSLEEQEAALENYILSYDNICHLDSLKAVEHNLPLPAPFDNMWWKIKEVIDRLHIQNHKDKKCKELYNPSSIPEEYNTMIAEQTFAWFSRFKKNANSMTQTHHLFFIHRNIIRRNNYTKRVRRRGREPLLPGINPKCAERL